MLNYTFDNYLVSNCNSLPVLACQAAVENGELYSPVLIHGPTGCGKTHLLLATKDYAEKRGVKTLYTHMHEVAENICRSLGSSDYELSAYDGYGLVLIDDLHCIENKPVTQHEAIFFLKALYDKGIGIVLACEDPFSKLPIFKKMFSDVFEYKLSLPLPLPDFELKRRFFKNLCEEAGVDVTDEALLRVAAHFKSNLPTLKGRFMTALHNAEGINRIDVDFTERYFHLKEAL